MAIDSINAQELKSICDSIVEKYNIPVFVGGDFNNGKNSPQGDDTYFEMLKMGFVDIRTIALDCTEQEYTCQAAYPVLCASNLVPRVRRASKNKKTVALLNVLLTRIIVSIIYSSMEILLVL